MKGGGRKANLKIPHQCVHCSRIIPAGSGEILQGCSSCGGRFFFYIRDDQLKEIEESKKRLVELESSEKRKIEEDVRKILKIEDETKPVILDFESIRVIQPGKFEIDIVSLINRRPIIFKIEEGKYLIDLESI